MVGVEQVLWDIVCSLLTLPIPFSHTSSACTSNTGTVQHSHTQAS